MTAFCVIGFTCIYLGFFPCTPGKEDRPMVCDAASAEVADIIQSSPGRTFNCKSLAVPVTIFNCESIGISAVYESVGEQVNHSSTHAYHP